MFTLAASSVKQHKTLIIQNGGNNRSFKIDQANINRKKGRVKHIIYELHTQMIRKMLT